MKVTNVASLILTFMLAVLFAAPMSAQMSPKEKRQLEREKGYYETQLKETEKRTKKLLRKRADRNARKESRKLRKDDYGVFPGSIPMDKQLEYCWMKQLERDDKGMLKYIFADGNGVAGTQTAAEMQAMEAAKLQLAGQISNEINQIVESKIANEQIDRETASTLTKFVAGGKNYIIQSLAYVKPAFKVYREVGKRNLEVAVKMYYSVEEAMIAAEKALEAKARADLEDEADDLIEEINKIFHDGR
jgi:hypothetical protein